MQSPALTFLTFFFQLLAENEELKEENERLTLYISKADELTKFLEVKFFNLIYI